jgi:GntR family transcriptional regulator
MNRFLTRPLYLQVRDALIERIATGQWKPGETVPNEGDLARDLGVSPGTMRKALDLMESMRLLTRRQGRGTVVNDPSAGELATRFNSLRSTSGAALVDEVMVGEIAEGAANEFESVRLRLTSTDRVFRFPRRRSLQGRPYLAEDVSLPATLFPGLGDEQYPVSEITSLAARYGLLLGRAEERVTIGNAPLEVAGALGVALQAPLLVLDRVVFSLDGRPIEWRHAWCHLAGGHYFAELK